MRPALRLFAAVKQGRVLEPGTPTGLTGLLTHPAPRSTLIYLYSSTLSKLQQIPETSVYRQATEALTKKRLAIIEAVKPAGFDAWEARMNHAVDNLGDQIGPKGLTYEGRRFILAKMWKKEQDVGDVEWDGLKPSKGMDGPKTQAEMDQLHEAEDKLRAADALERPSLEPEPLFTIEQYVSSHSLRCET
jgi:NADH dehydrogenase (ubiquinone) 1 alpha subcomplex subunit 5